MCLFIKDFKVKLAISPHLPACNAPSPSACVTPARLGTAVTQHLHEDLRSSTGLFLT